MTDLRPFSTPSPFLVFPAATSKLNCTPGRKPPIPIDWDQPLFIDPTPPVLSWTKIDTTLQRHHPLPPRNPSPPIPCSLSSSSTSSSSYVSSMTSAQSSGRHSSLLYEHDNVSLHLYHARFTRKKKSPFRGLVARMKRAAERPFRLIEP